MSVTDNRPTEKAVTPKPRALPATEAEFKKAIDDAYAAGKAGFDIGAYTIRPRTKLAAIAFLLGESRNVNTMENDEMVGLQWILDDITKELTPDGEGGDR
jgi:hypothetical protein